MIESGQVALAAVGIRKCYANCDRTDAIHLRIVRFMAASQRYSIMYRH
jgi:hypothetical protein